MGQTVRKLLVFIARQTLFGVGATDVKKTHKVSALRELPFSCLRTLIKKKVKT